MVEIKNTGIMKNILTLIVGALFSVVAFAQTEAPAPKQTKSILLLNGTAHLGNGEVIENAAIGFENGKITLAADARTIKLEEKAYEEVMNIQGKHVYPGIIAPNSTLGLVEIDAVRATRDYDETGSYTPHVRSIIAYNTTSKITTTVRTNGVLMAQITPRGNRISGTSSVVHLDAWNWEDALYRLDDGVHVNWVKMYSWWSKKLDKDYNKKVDKLKEFFVNAEAYAKTEKPEEMNLRFEALKGVFAGEKTLFIHANFVKEITDAVQLAKSFGIKKVSIVGGYDAWRVADMLKDNNVSVVLRRVHELPANEDDDIYISYKLPAMLYKTGVLFCLENSGDMEAMGTRNLPFYAGTAASYGMDKEEALKLITLNAAKILGIERTVGSLEEGKDATLFISNGDALDMMGNDVTNAFIQGRSIDLDNHQKKLFRTYTEKYKQQ